MTNLFYETLGVESATFSLRRPGFLDTHGYFFDNVFGDLSTTGSSLANPSTTTSGVLPVGATAVTLASAPPAAVHGGRDIQIGSGADRRGRGHQLDRRVERGELRRQPAAVHPPDRADRQTAGTPVHPQVRRP